MARIGKRRGADRVLGGNLREEDLLEDLGLDGIMALKMDLQKIKMGPRICPRIGTGGGLL
jgi:hypothetical protein